MAWSLTLLLSIAVVASSAFRINTNPQNYGRQNIIKEVPEGDLDLLHASRSHKLMKREVTNSIDDRLGESIESAYTPKIDKSCENSTFCEIDLNYPQEAVDKAIEELQQKGVIVSLQVDTLSVPDSSDFGQRVALPSEQKINLCPTTEKKIAYPKFGIDDQGRRHSLLNRDKGKDPVQGFRVSICEKSGCDCKLVDQYAYGYSARCLQRYDNRQATAFRMLDNGKLETFQVQVKLPSYCECLGQVV